ncbi:MAG: serine hydrolase [Deltaproteobacteria bacterium]|nr:serine hydrolase [Deltaproteobacteria bacterium]
MRLQLTTALMSMMFAAGYQIDVDQVKEAAFSSSLVSAQIRSETNSLPETEFSWAQELEAALPAIIPPGVSIALFVKEPHGEKSFSHRGDVPVYLASGIKIFFMVEVYRQLDEGSLSLDEKIYYGWGDVRDGAPAMNRRKIGSYVKLGELLTFMIRDSDNAATDLLLKRIGVANVNTGLEELGFAPIAHLVNMMHVRREVYASLDERARKLSSLKIRDIRWRDGHHPRLDLLRKHIGVPYRRYTERDLENAYDEYYASGMNHVPLDEVAALLATLHRRELISDQASVEMLERLRKVWNSGNRIAGLLGDRAALVRHKTGTQRRRICDLALVPFDNGEPLVVTIAIAGPRHGVAETILREVVQEVLELERSERNRIRPKQSDWANVQ